MAKKSLPNSISTNKSCSVEGCNQLHAAKGLCNIHYNQKRRENMPLCSSDGCSKKQDVRGYCSKHSLRLRMHGDINKVLRNNGVGNTPEERFWSRVQKNANAKGCWEWQGSLNDGGYGVLRYNEKQWRAHRLSYFLTVGQVPSLLLLHSCDNPKCVNPEHLSEGTHQDNIQDKINKNRQPKGETHCNAKLTNDLVKKIKTAIKAGERNCDIARAFYISQVTVAEIKTGKTWKHVQI